MKQWKVFCADCMQQYTQKDVWGQGIPKKCGFCGSTWIAVKEIAELFQEKEDDEHSITGFTPSDDVM
jgi:hypothetical protein